MSELLGERFADFARAVHGDGRDPFPWQQSLLDYVLARGDWPEAIDAPTGLGKTSVLDIAVYALAAGFPARRVFFVVDRRISVDEAFEHACTLQKKITDATSGVLGEVRRELAARAPGTGESAFAVTRMRGGSTWDWRWVDRPDRVAIVVGTVDEVGSRMFFRGSGVSNRLAPIDAAMVGTDAILFLDEAHKAQPMIETIRAAQELDRPEHRVGRPTAVVRLSATHPDDRGVALPFDAAAHLQDGEAARRLRAAKTLHTVATTERASASIVAAAAAAAVGEDDRALVGVVTNTVAKARSVYDKLADAGVPAILVTGRQRPWDRDKLLTKYRRRLAVGWRDRAGITEPLVVVATQTLEVGNVDVSALITESAPWDSLILRIGLLNRFGRAASPEHVVVVHAEGVKADAVYGEERATTWRWLSDLAPPRTWKAENAVDYAALTTSGVGVSPLQLRALHAPAGASSTGGPAPTLFRQHLLGWSRTAPVPVPDVPVTPFLRGFTNDPQTVRVIWRGDLTELSEDTWEHCRNSLISLPPHADEELELPLSVARAWLGDTAIPPLADIDLPAVPPVAPASTARPVLRIYGASNIELVHDPRRLQPGDRIVVPCSYGGIDTFGWAPRSTEPALDIADVTSHRRTLLRLHEATLVPLLLHLGGKPAAGQAEGLLADLKSQLHTLTLDEFPTRVSLRHLSPDDDAHALLQRIIELYRDCTGRGAENDYRVIMRPVRQDNPLDALMLSTRAGAGGNDTPTGSSVSETPQSLPEHHAQVAAFATVVTGSLGLPGYLQRSVELAARWHDLGKLDRRFQIMLFGGAAHEADNALRTGEPRAKSGIDPNDRPRLRNARRASDYPEGGRHEALSAALARHRLTTESPDVDADLVLHLVATHHGHARPMLPHVPDLEQPPEITVPGDAAPTPLPSYYGVDWTGPQRFARLRERYGIWGLALLEAVLRQADIACSAGEHSAIAKAINKPAPTEPSSYRELDHRAPGKDAVPISVPALDGRVPLGFLAALGLHRLVTEHLDAAATLCWDPLHCRPAITTDALSTLDELADWLIELATGQPAEVRQPGWPPGFPPPGAAPDRLVPARAGFPDLLTTHPEARELIGTLVTDLGVNNDGRVRRTPMVAPTGKQSFATMLSNQDATIRAHPDLLRQALTRWRRIGGTTAESFDNQAITGGADRDGTPGERAVPGAVWLAIAGLPGYRLAVDIAGRATATGWRRINRRATLIWPLWTPALDAHAIQALLEHPRITITETTDGAEADLHELVPLGVTRVCAARRVNTGNSDGPLTLIPVTPTGVRGGTLVTT